MNTKILMTVSALLLCIVGIVLSFAPQELAAYFSADGSSLGNGLILQILGAVYFAFGMINWTAKANLIGGIYSRPIAIGNLTHFTIGALALLKAYSRGQEEIIVLIAAITYTLFAILFGMVFFTHPVKADNA
jgi:hypothetical protein